MQLTIQPIHHLDPSWFVLDAATAVVRHSSTGHKLVSKIAMIALRNLFKIYPPKLIIEYCTHLIYIRTVDNSPTGNLEGMSSFNLQDSTVSSNSRKIRAVVRNHRSSVPRVLAACGSTFRRRQDAGATNRSPAVSLIAGGAALGRLRDGQWRRRSYPAMKYGYSRGIYRRTRPVLGSARSGSRLMKSFCHD
jgi:hypothetical protein